MLKVDMLDMFPVVDKLTKYKDAVRDERQILENVLEIKRVDGSKEYLIIDAEYPMLKDNPIVTFLDHIEIDSQDVEPLTETFNTISVTIRTLKQLEYLLEAYLLKKNIALTPPFKHVALTSIEVELPAAI